MWILQWVKSTSKKNRFDIPIANFGKVTDTLYRGALTDTDGYRALVEKLGVVRVCSMIEHERHQDSRRAIDAGIKEWLPVPFSDKDTPRPEKVKHWLDYVRTSDEKGAVYVHCRGGRHRTGVLVGVYRVTDFGWTKEQAYNEMKQYGWYSALGHEPLIEWFLEEFNPDDYRKEDQARKAGESP